MVLRNNSEVLIVKSGYLLLHLEISCAMHVPALSVWPCRAQHLS